MQGEELDHLDLDDRGVIGDRRWAVLDPAAGVVITGRRDPALLMATGRLDGDGRAEVVLPAGRVTRDDGELSAWLGRPVRLVAAADRCSTYEIPVDPEDDASDVATWQGPPRQLRRLHRHGGEHRRHRRDGLVGRSPLPPQRGHRGR